jgi:hypothetical protein
MERKPWTKDDIAKLRAMAQKFPTAQIAAEIGRGHSATVMKAHELRISLSMRPSARRPSIDPEPAGMDL